MALTRGLATILAADVVGYSRLMGEEGYSSTTRDCCRIGGLHFREEYAFVLNTL
jgi:hypothetical protein